MSDTEPKSADTASATASPVTPLAAPEQLEPKPAISQPEKEDKVAALEARMREIDERNAQLVARIEEDNRRTRSAVKDTNRSLLLRIQERFGPETRTIDEWEQTQRITPDEANAERLKVRTRIEREEAQRERENEVTAQRQFAEQENARVNRAMLQSLRSSGLVEGDPEAASLPQEVPDGLTPDQAVQWYAGEVEKLKGQKSERLKQEEKARLQQAQKAAVPVDMGGGPAAPALEEKPKPTLDDIGDLGPLIRERLSAAK